MTRAFCGRGPVPFAGVVLALAALYAFFVWADAFDRLATFVQAHQVWELEEVLALLLVLGVVCPFACLWTFVEPRNKEMSSKEMSSREDFIKDIASGLGKDRGDSAVFVVEMGSGVDEGILHRVEEMLADVVGADRLTSFRVR